LRIYIDYKKTPIGTSRDIGAAMAHQLAAAGAKVIIN
jgi:short-subunit dehydrogenase